jgi:hypothetical protein
MTHQVTPITTLLMYMTVSCIPAGVIALANAIPDMGALSMLDASYNGMFGFEDMAGITAWAASLKANTSITGLNLAKNDMNADDAKIIAPAISDNRALTKLTFGDKQVVIMTTKMTEANFSGKLRSYEAQIVAAFLPKCTYVPEYPLLVLADTRPTIGPCRRLP